MTSRMTGADSFSNADITHNTDSTANAGSTDSGASNAMGIIDLTADVEEKKHVYADGKDNDKDTLVQEYKASMKPFLVGELCACRGMYTSAVLIDTHARPR